jgi:biotin transport system substrate-specific component
MVNSNNLSDSPVRKMVYAALFASMTAVGAYISIPVGMVPVTLQTLFVILAGAVLGARWGMLSMFIYVLLGIVGLPVFSGGSSGLGVLAGPTGGYIIGFILAALVIGYLFENFQNRSIAGMVAIFLVGMIAIYVPGYFQLMYVASLGVQESFALGVAPFIPGAAIKIAAATIIYRYLKTESLV